MDNLEATFKLFDEYNQQDPRTFVWEGQIYPQEYFFALKLHEWVVKLDPNASEELLLASRCQHIGRWEMPREDYPEGREAYLKWRKDLAQRHATIATRLLATAGYTAETIDRVTEILLKKRLKVDADVQTMENALCLVFLQYQYDTFREKYAHDPDKMVNILRKSLLKMDAHGHAFALKLPYTQAGAELIKQALDRVR